MAVYSDDFVGPLRPSDTHVSEAVTTKEGVKSHQEAYKKPEKKKKKRHRSSHKNSSKPDKPTQKIEPLKTSTPEPLKMTTREGVVDVVPKPKTQREVYQDLVKKSRTSSRETSQQWLERQERERLKGEPTQFRYDAKTKKYVTPETFPTQKIISEDTGTKTRTQFQREFLEKPTGVIQYGTPMDGSRSPFKTKGDIQTERELERFKIQTSYQDKIQRELDKDLTRYSNQREKVWQKYIDDGSMSLEQAQEGFQKELQIKSINLQSSKKYKDLEKQFQREYLKPKDVPGLLTATGEPSGSRFTDVPIVGSLIDISKKGEEFLESERRWGDVKDIAQKPIKERTKEETLKYYSTLYEGRDRRSEKALSFLGATALGAVDVLALGGLSKAGVKMSQTAIKKELAKRTSVSLENLAKSKVTGVQIIEKNTGEFVLRAKQGAGKFLRRFEIKGKLVKSGKSYSFIPSGKGRSVVVGLSEANLKGVSGKVKTTLASLTGKKPKALYLGVEDFEVAGAGISRKVPGKLGEITAQRTAGFGVVTPEKSAFAYVMPTTKKKTRAEVLKQLKETRKFGGDSLITQSITPEFIGKKGVSLQVSKDTDMLSLLYSKPKPSIKTFKVSPKIKAPIKQPSKLDSFLFDKTKVKPSPKIKTPSKARSISTKRIEQQPKFDFIEQTLGRTTPTKPFKPFQFATKKSFGMYKYAPIIGVLPSPVRSKTGIKSIYASQTPDVFLSQLSNVSLAKSSLTKRPTTQKQVKTPSAKSPSIPTISSSFLSGLGPSFTPKIRRVPSKNYGERIKKMKPVRKKKKRSFELEKTGLQAITGQPARRKKKLSRITGFEFFR